jgi:Tfp pilus assembly protein PilN
MNVQIVIATLQKKISDLTLTNVMLEAQISDLQSQLNSIKETKTTENAINGSGTNQNQAQEIDDGNSRPDDF